MKMQTQRLRLVHLSLGERSDRACDPGEGLRPNDRAYPLTPTLCPWERERAAEIDTLISFMD